MGEWFAAFVGAHPVGEWFVVGATPPSRFFVGATPPSR
jgi:hypothetical protein